MINRFRIQDGTARFSWIVSAVLVLFTFSSFRLRYCNGLPNLGMVTGGVRSSLVGLTLVRGTSLGLIGIAVAMMITLGTLNNIFLPRILFCKVDITLFAYLKQVSSSLVCAIVLLTVALPLRILWPAESRPQLFGQIVATAITYFVVVWFVRIAATDREAVGQRLRRITTRDSADKP